MSMSNKSVSTSLFFLALVALHGIQKTEERHLKNTSLEIDRMYKKGEFENPSNVVTCKTSPESKQLHTGILRSGLTDIRRRSVLRKEVITHPTAFQPTNPGNSPGVGHSHGRH